jgi:hypothetical protein
MSLVPWLQINKKARVRKDRDRQVFVSPNCSVCERPVQLETSRVDELGKAVHEECYVLKVKQRTAHFLPLCLQKGVATECWTPPRNFSP